ILGPRQRSRVRVRAPRRTGDPRRGGPEARDLRALEAPRPLIRLELDRLQVELAGLRVRGFRDREILDRKARRVEEGDVAGAPAAVRVADEHGSEFRDALARDGAGLGCCGELAAVTRLLPVVAEDVGAADLLDRDLCLARTIGPHESDVLAPLE